MSSKELAEDGRDAYQLENGFQLGTQPVPGPRSVRNSFGLETELTSKGK